MDVHDTNLLIYHDENPPGTPRESEIEEDEDEHSDGIQDFLDKIRFYNKQGPHYIYNKNGERNRKINHTRRLIKKSGKYNVSRHVESQIWDKYLRDLCNTLVHSRWRWTVITAASSYILSWLLFSMIWMLISNANGDLELQDDNLKCLLGVKGFAGFFMLSLETQVSIGYGSRSINDHCPEVVFVICLQIIFGVGICGLTVNIVYIKMTKSQNKYSKLFSKNAVICRRDGELSLIFRVRDEDSRHAIGTTVTAYILRKDNETREPYLETMPLQPHGFLIWPLEIVHKITSDSPLWDVSSYNLLSDKFEIIVTLQGTSPTTAQCSRTRTSFISSEILWGHKFKNCVKFAKKERAYVVNQKNFNATEEHSTHLCSAKRFSEVYSSLCPTPTVGNYNFQLNFMYSSQRRGTVVSIETADGSCSKIDEQSISSKHGKEKPNQSSSERIKEPSRDQYLDSPVSPLSPIEEYYNQKVIYSSGYDNLNNSKSNSVQNYWDPYQKQWGYQNYTENRLPDFWLKEAASMPLINNNYSQDIRLKTRKFGSDLEHLGVKSLYGTSGNFYGSKGMLNHHRVFEGEEFVFENGISAEESNVSLLSVDYPRSDVGCEQDPELDAMLRSMESYLEQNSDGMSTSSFPKM